MYLHFLRLKKEIKFQIYLLDGALLNILKKNVVWKKQLGLINAPLVCDPLK